MQYKAILQILAPCGLNCQKCCFRVDGDIQSHAKALQEHLGRFETYAKRFSKFWPIFKNYSQFKTMLDHFATAAECVGCRNCEKCTYPTCNVKSCVKTKKIDFCFQCENFPCSHSGFDPNLKKRWIKMNDRMKDIGVTAYFEEIKDLPRYQ